MQTVAVFTLQCAVDAVINGVQQYCSVGCETHDTWLQLMNVKLSARIPIQIIQASVNGLIHLVAAVSLSKGVSKDESYFPPSLMEETLSNSFSANKTRIIRSKIYTNCWHVSQKSICKPAVTQFIYARKTREKKHNPSDLHEDEENKKLCYAPAEMCKVPNSEGKSNAPQWWQNQCPPQWWNWLL